MSALATDLSTAAAAGFDALVGAAVAAFGDTLTVACSFGVEDMVVLDAVADAASHSARRPSVFLLDTGRLHQETYDLIDRARARYALPFKVFTPESSALEELIERDGPNGFYLSVEARQACCGVRKVAPLGRALAGASAWMTGLRREQSAERAAVPAVEQDHAHGGLWKINPLFDWTHDQVWERARQRDIPVHALHAQGFASIGCAPCTRAIAPGEPIRAGRWWWEEGSGAHKECGLHTIRVDSDGSPPLPFKDVP